ncbi:hypothetical protein CPB84DRAFT_1842781 [Gymnopilus junonius]|uniref:Uncharacterized protein n=1 Tax=Gymnopilus junonius TaxID=109634 RepID=A0A9P5TSV6_GYMJU|nr:hypothetical protein CPB84DRAFT_1842781 [Gymnopilus junonius]
MRFATIAVFYPLLQVTGRISGRPLPYEKPHSAPAVRDLLSLLGLEGSTPAVDGLGGLPTVGGDQNPALPAPAATNIEQPLPTRLHTESPIFLSSTSIVSAGNMVPTASAATAADVALSTRIGIVSLSSHRSNQGSTATATPSLVGSLSGSGTTGSDTNAASASGSDGYVASDASTTPPAELTEWKVIGVAVITITLIGTLVLSVTFFDQWWGFLRAVLCGKRARRKRDAEMFGSGGEDMVPDWNRRSWKFKLDSEYGHRYPDMGTFGSVEKEKVRGQSLAKGQKGQTILASPEAFPRL